MVNSKQPEALRLAEWSDWFCRNVNDPEDFRWVHMKNAAAELRRLYALNQELLDVLKNVVESWHLGLKPHEDMTTSQEADEVITKAEAEGETK